MIFSDLKQKESQGMENKEKQIFVFQPFSVEFDITFQLITVAAENAGVQTVARYDQFAIAVTGTETLYNVIEKSDLIICDTTGSDPSVMYALGYAHAHGRPVILISQRFEPLPFDFRSVVTLLYDVKIGRQTKFVQDLKTLIQSALNNPGRFSAPPKTVTSINTVFVSYSRKDGEFLERLQVHLKPLERQGLIDLWDDTKIKVGDHWKETIEKALKRARVAILILSADYLASDFIVENELPPLLVKAESEGTRIMPVIVKACRFSRDKNLNRFQAINDPKIPLVNMTKGDQEQVYDKLSQEVEKYMAGTGTVVA
jgi:hypothetical protein